MVKIQGYEINEQLYNGSRTSVYRAVRENDQKPVVIKILQNAYPSFNELLQFRNQYTIAKNLDIPGIVRPYSLEPYQNSYALVMEDFGGVSLHEYVQMNDGVSLQKLLSIVVQVADILHNLHQNRVIHKDIKPANIKDISEKFLIPEKLYGRETEVQQLLAAFEQVSNGDNELILVAGFSGIGKTAVVLLFTTKAVLNKLLSKNMTE
ncbi:MAG: protein kinase [Richelia sp. RM2_1_2]|nr:protein kinase [Richelia sp. RM1_1_1]NJO59498.1 protein kinase [Richelia sp. RM2_1_2]